MISPTCAAATKAVEDRTVLGTDGIKKLHARCRARPVTMGFRGPNPGIGAAKGDVSERITQAFICECACHGAASGNDSTH